MQKSGRKGAGNCNRKSCNARKWQERGNKLPLNCVASFLSFGDGAQTLHCNMRDHQRLYVFLWIGCAGYWLTNVRIATKTLWPHTGLAKCIDFPTSYQSRTQPNAISFAAGLVLFSSLPQTIIGPRETQSWTYTRFARSQKSSNTACWAALGPKNSELHFPALLLPLKGCSSDPPSMFTHFREPDGRRPATARPPPGKFRPRPVPPCPVTEPWIGKKQTT